MKINEQNVPGDATRLDSLTNSNKEVTHKRPLLTTVSKIQLVQHGGAWYLCV